MTIILLKSTLFWLISFSLYFFYLRKTSNFEFNRFFLLGSLLLGSIIPFLQFELPIGNINTQINEEFANTILIPSVTVGEKITSQLALWTIIKYAYGSILLVLIARIIYGIFKLRKLQTIPKKSFSYANMKIVEIQNAYATFSFWNTIFWNNQYALDSQEGKYIFEHEVAHVQQKHFLDNLVTELICIIFWFHPLVWLFRKAISQNHEYLADHAVLREQTEVMPYANLLVSHIFLPLDVPIGPYFHKSLTLNRIKMMKNNQSSSPLFRIIAITLLSSIAFFFACENSQSEEEQELINPLNKIRIYSVPQLEEDAPDGEGGVFEIVEEPATPDEGIANYLGWVGQNLKYPKEAQEMGIEGIVYVEFIIDEEGNVTEPKIAKGIHPSCDKEALSVIAKSPKWNPAKQRGRLVKQRIVLPVFFKLN